MQYFLNLKLIKIYNAMFEYISEKVNNVIYIFQKKIIKILLLMNI